MFCVCLAELDSYEDRVNEIHRLVDQLPEPNKRMLELLLHHLENVAERCDRNMMNVSNLGVCFGPTLLRAEEETVAAIMDIKFANVVVEILIENWRKFLTGDDQPSKAALAHQQQQQQNNNSPSHKSHAPPAASSSSQLTVLPLSGGRGAASSSSSTRLVSPPHRPPPPYQNPPPPPHPTAPPPNPPSLSGPPPSGTIATLAHAVIYNNGPKQVRDHISYFTATY